MPAASSGILPKRGGEFIPDAFPEHFSKVEKKLLLNLEQRHQTDRSFFTAVLWLSPTP